MDVYSFEGFTHNKRMLANMLLEHVGLITQVVFQRIDLFQKQKVFAAFHFAVTVSERIRDGSYARLKYVVLEHCLFRRSIRFGDTDCIFKVKGTLTMS